MLILLRIERRFCLLASVNTKHYAPNEILVSETFDLLSQIFLGFAEFLLKSPQQFIVFAFGKREIVIAQLRVFLLQFPFYFVPTTFEF
jgi:hypothetical protein